MVFLIASALAMPAMADGHGDHRKGGERLKNAVKKMDALIIKGGVAVKRARTTSEAMVEPTRSS